MSNQQTRIEDPASWKAIQAIVWYFENVAFETFWAAVFADSSGDDGYSSEWRSYYVLGVAATWGRLDRKHRNRLISAATQRYAQDLDREIAAVNAA